MFGGSPQKRFTGGDVLNERQQSRDAVGVNKTLDNLHGEGLFRVGGVKNPQFLFPAKKP